MNNTQRGITLIETVGALAISAMMLVGLAAMIDSAMQDSKGQQAALYQAQVAAAARKYIAANYADLVTKTPTAATVATIDVPELTKTKFLPDNFPSTNVYGQSSCVLVRQPNPASPPPPTPTGKERLDALVVTTGGEPIEFATLPAAAASAGQGSGYIPENEFKTARGASFLLGDADLAPYRNIRCAGGGTAVLTGTESDGGHLVSILLFDGPGQLSTDFLYRNEIPGRPDLNTMNTGIRLASKAVVTEGTDCRIVPNGSVTPVAVAAIAVDAANQLLTCDSDGTWTAVTTWKRPVNNFPELATLPPATVKRGDVRMTKDKGRAFMYNGSTWIALAVDQNGDIAIERDAIIGNNAEVGQTVNAGHDINASHNVTADNDIVGGRDITAARDIKGRNITASKEVRGIETVRGGYITSDTVVETQELYLTTPYKAGANCHIPVQVNGETQFILPVGTVVRDQNALLLVCMDDKKLRYPNGTLNP